MMTALVTGSTRGLGRAIAMRMAELGHGVVIHGRKREALDEMMALDFPRFMDSVAGCLDDDDDLFSVVLSARTHKVDILVNNAGIYSNGDPADTAPAMDAILGTNLVAPIKLTLGVYRMMKARKSGLIININSIAGKIYNDREAVYCASKHGLKGFMSSLKYDANKHGIGILDIYAGAMKTEMTKGRDGWDALMDPAEVADYIVTLATTPFHSMRVNEIEIGRRV